MTPNKFTKSVAFNLSSPKDMAIIEYMKKKNFSGYVKRLILADMKEKNIQIPVKKEKSLSKLELLKQQLASTQQVQQRTDSETNPHSNN